MVRMRSTCRRRIRRRRPSCMTGARVSGAAHGGDRFGKVSHQRAAIGAPGAAVNAGQGARLLLVAVGQGTRRPVSQIADRNHGRDLAVPRTSGMRKRWPGLRLCQHGLPDPGQGVFTAQVRFGRTMRRQHNAAIDGQSQQEAARSSGSARQKWIDMEKTGEWRKAWK